MAIDRLEYDAWIAEALQLAAPLVDPPLHVQNDRILAAAVLEHLGLEFHAAVAAVAIQRAQNFEDSAHPHHFTRLQIKRLRRSLPVTIGIPWRACPQLE